MDIGRRKLFTSFKKQQEQYPVIRPPYAKDESVFAKECASCDGKCATLCQEQIIVIAEDKTPVLDFTKGGCTYCDECAKACEPGVLQVEHKQRIKAEFAIDMLKCLSWNHTMCFSCKDPCLDKAIDFLGMFRPEIDAQKCTACGFCVGVCPAGAIGIKGVHEK